MSQAAKQSIANIIIAISICVMILVAIFLLAEQTRMKTEVTPILTPAEINEPEAPVQESTSQPSSTNTKKESPAKEPTQKENQAPKEEPTKPLVGCVAGVCI